ncbi:MAG: flagellin, partial [Planctomycetes bacterium]|nr:flagellin [Planctomycetota bacterium]
IYKRDGYTVSFGFTGAVNASSIDNIGDADMSKQAMKAYMEIDPVADTLSQIDEDGYLTQSQSFILTGALGSRQFNFGAGTSITQIVTSIQSYADSTGIDASLIFNSNQTINQSINVANATSIAGACGTTSARTWGDATIFDNYFIDGDDNRQTLITGIDTDTLTGVQYGFNTDGNGNIYVKYIGNGQYELYKDSSFSEATLIGVSDSTGNVVERNNSGIGGLKLTFHDDAQYGDTAYISLGNIALDGNNVHASGVMNGDASNGNGFSLEGSIASGVQLGINTDANGKIFIKVVTDEDGMSVVYAYNDESMSSSSLVAQSDKVYLVAGEAVILDQIWNSDGTASTGLGLHLNITDDMTDPDGYYDGWIQFTNLGARISSSEYGSDAFIQVQQSEGGLFTYYDQPDSYKSATLVDAAGTGVTVRITGQDATINVNGQQMKTNGLKLDMATTDIMAKVVFNSGKSGSTTIAQVGYNEGTIFTKATALTFSKREAIDDGSANQFFSALLNNACHNTKEAISKFQGGMQLQLGETAGDQSRTVVSLKSMAVSNLGQIKVTRAFDSSSAVIETRTLSLSDVLGGQIASLTEDPVLAMRIIEQAIDDVSVMRAQIGALQANLLQTNANNLEVAIENITNTESAIRDTDMATEMTNYTAAQVLQNAGISMLAQANSQAQSVLSLLQ